MGLEIKGLTKSYDKILFENVNLDIERGEIVAILGNSGCGKSTLLRIVCGLEVADSGTLKLDGQDLVEIDASKRKIGMIFQKPVLYPHLTVEKNLILGIPKDIQKSEHEKLVQDILETVQLPNFGKRRVDELSGGEKQRVSFARAVLAKPKALLMDEPFSALDNEIRNELCDWTRDYLKSLNVPAIHVTHDVNEANRIADRVLNFKDFEDENK